MVPLAILGVVLSVVAQVGDLLKSAVKRHFGVKDSSHLIPAMAGCWTVWTVSLPQSLPQH